MGRAGSGPRLPLQLLLLLGLLLGRGSLGLALGAPPPSPEQLIAAGNPPGQQVVILVSPAAPIRHQQSQRPSFIQRKLHDQSQQQQQQQQPPIVILTSEQIKQQDVIVATIQPSPEPIALPQFDDHPQAQTELQLQPQQQQQIRHGRSRSRLLSGASRVRNAGTPRLSTITATTPAPSRNLEKNAEMLLLEASLQESSDMLLLDGPERFIGNNNNNESTAWPPAAAALAIAPSSTSTPEQQYDVIIEEQKRAEGRWRKAKKQRKEEGRENEEEQEEIPELEELEMERGYYGQAIDNNNNNETLGVATGFTNENDEDDDGLGGGPEPGSNGQVDIVTRFLRIIENQHLLGENCTAGTDLNLGEGVVDQYAQERFRLEANLAVNRANMLTRLWKYAPDVMSGSEYLLHASVLSMVEFDEDIFAAGNCYDKLQYKDRWLYCPFAHRLQNDDGVLVKDLAVEYKYLSNSSEWFYIARKNAERRIANYDQQQFSRGYHTYTHNESSHTKRIEDEILTVRYEDGRWSKPYYDCGGGNIWMLTYTVPFFGYVNDTYYFKGTSGIDIDLRRVDIDQCPLPPGSVQLNIFAASDKCKKRTTECVAIPGLGFRRGSYRCVCKRGFYYPDTKSSNRYYNGTVVEEEYEKLILAKESQYSKKGIFECLPCAEGCDSCEDDSPCVVTLNWLMRTIILALECCVIACLPIVVFFTWKYGNVKVVRAASPVLLRVIVLGAFFIYCTTIVMYPQPNVVTCTVRVWLREIGFSLTYGALMLKTWRISVIFRVRSAKAIKITDMNLLKRLGVIVTIFSTLLGIRTLVAPPVVIVARTADDLKAYLCQTDWWDHSFTTLEVMFLCWGIRLCIVVRKAPSEFNESRFISMAIYNEFLLSVFLNVSMFFLQSSANPDLLYIIFFCHTQLTVTLLLALIFGSKAYVVFRGGGKDDLNGKLTGTTSKFLGKTSRAPATSNQTNSISLHQANLTEDSDGMTEEFRRLCTQLEMLKEKNIRLGNRQLVEKIIAMQEAANRAEVQISAVHAISWTLHGNEAKSDPSTSIRKKVEDLKGPDHSHNGQETSVKDTEKKGSETDVETKKEKKKDKGNGEDVDKKVDEGEKGDNTAGDLPKSVVAKESEEQSKDKDKDKDRNRSKSGHARTHAIVINLDDKSRFSEEVTV